MLPISRYPKYSIRLLKEQVIHYVVEGNNIVLTKNITEHASTQQQKQITGERCRDRHERRAYHGASVVEKGTTNGTITDLDGNFTLKVPSDAIINITYVGYQPQSLSVSGQPLSRSDGRRVDGTGAGSGNCYGYQEKSPPRLTYSTQQLGGDELTRAKDPT